MNRVGDYIRFAVGFTGLGYIVLWPLTAYDVGFVTLHLSPGLHLAGMMSSACVLIGLALRPLRRWRGRAAGERAPTPPALARLRIGKRCAPAPAPRRYVRPRSHFGLRGTPR